MNTLPNSEVISPEDITYIDNSNALAFASKPAWWAWLTILSLDAPIVAVLWQLLIANSFGFIVKPLHSILLFVTVWLIYVVDRCFDSIVITKAFTTRHGFYKRYLATFIILISIVASFALVAAVRWLEPTIFLHGIILSGIVLLYLANLHLPKKPILLIPKELQIGLVFATGSTLTFWSQLHSLGNVESILFILVTICFAMLCFLNCSFISLWEKSVDILHKQPSMARASNIQTLTFQLKSAVLILIAISILLPIGFELRVAFILSSLGLWLLQYTQAKTSVDLRRVLADVVLMTPLLSLLVVLLLQ